VRRQVLYLTLTSWLDKRTENADRERLAQAEKDRRASRLLPSSLGNGTGAVDTPQQEFCYRTKQNSTAQNTGAHLINS